MSIACHKDLRTIYPLMLTPCVQFLGVNLQAMKVITQSPVHDLLSYCSCGLIDAGFYTLRQIFACLSSSRFILASRI